MNFGIVDEQMLKHKYRYRSTKVPNCLPGLVTRIVIFRAPISVAINLNRN